VTRQVMVDERKELIRQPYVVRLGGWTSEQYLREGPKHASPAPARPLRVRPVSVVDVTGVSTCDIDLRNKRSAPRRRGFRSTGWWTPSGGRSRSSTSGVFTRRPS